MSPHGELTIERLSSVPAIRQEAPGDASIVQIIEKLAQTPSLTLEQVTVVERLMAMQERQEEQRRRECFFESLRLCQMEMPRVQKNGLIDPKGAKIAYAKLEDLDACIRPIYQSHGFSVMFGAPMNIDGTKIRNVAHFSCAGHTETMEITASPSNRNTGRLQMTNAQAVKQTITECRRHLLEMFFNIITVGADEMKEEDCIDQNQADEIRTRMNDLPQSRPGALLSRLCGKYGIERPEELRISQYDAASKDVADTEKAKAKQ